MITKVKVLDIPVYDGDISSFVSEVIETEVSENRCISASGAHGFIESRYDKHFHTILNEFYYNLPDGKPGVWVARAKGAKSIKRCFGPFVFQELMKASSDTDIKHYFAGGREGIADQLKDAVSKKFNNNNVVGTHCPPFREIEEWEFKELAAEIDSLNTDIVWVGISTPKQEKYAHRLAKYTNVKYLITVGAAFDYHTDSIVPAPSWVQEAGLEWAFRLYMEPRRLWKRYINIVPKFLVFGILDIFGAYKYPLNN